MHGKRGASGCGTGQNADSETARALSALDGRFHRRRHVFDGLTSTKLVAGCAKTETEMEKRELYETFIFVLEDISTAWH